MLEHFHFMAHSLRALESMARRDLENKGVFHTLSDNPIVV